jgi:hypothetical protein
MRPAIKWCAGRLITLLICVMAIWLLAGASAQARIPCRPAPGTRTVAHSAKARIFEYARDGNYYACLYSSGRPHFLSLGEHYFYRLVRFAGPYVAFVQNIEAEDDHIGVMNLRSGHLHNYQETPPIENGICAEVNSLVLKRDGAVAWIATNFPEGLCGNPPGPIIEVHRHDSRGAAVLDQGAGIVPTSLHLAGSLLSWLDPGHTNSANLL